MELFDSPSLTRLDLALKSMGQQSVERRRTGLQTQRSHHGTRSKYDVR